MSISIQMPNSTSRYEINESRVQRLLSGDKKHATYMGLWDRFKDNFRTEKKADAIERLYDFIHGPENTTSFEGCKDYGSFTKEMSSFLLLKSLATEVHQPDFVVAPNAYFGVDFCLGDKTLKTLDHSSTFLSMFQLNHSETLKDDISSNANNAFQIKHDTGLAVYHGLRSKIEAKTASDEDIRLYQALLNRPQSQLDACLAVQQHGLDYALDDFSQNSESLFDFDPHFSNPEMQVTFDPISSEFTITHTAYGSSKLWTTPETTSFQHLSVSYTISPEGNIKCSSLHCLDKIPAPETNKSPLGSVEFVSTIDPNELHQLQLQATALAEKSQSFQPKSKEKTMSDYREMIETHLPQHEIDDLMERAAALTDTRPSFQPKSKEKTMADYREMIETRLPQHEIDDLVKRTAKFADNGVSFQTKPKHVPSLFEKVMAFIPFLKFT